ncbi:S24 family peptidase [Pseudomonas putida]|uniref:S24 family peptidase n=1 Tax=Pseudomonas putida TaxID=303 RepID=UPI003D961959
MNTTKTSPSETARLFKARRQQLNLTQAQLAEMVSKILPPGEQLSQQTYAAFESGKSQSSKHRGHIAKALGILDKLLELDLGLSYEAPKQAVEPNAAMLGPIEAWDDDTPLDDDEVEVPLLKEVELSAGSGRVAIQAHSKAKLRFGKITLRKQGVQPENAVCVSVYGNSMEPVLPHGSTVGVDRGKTTVKDGDIYALDHNGQLRVKILYRLPSGGMRLRSFNRDEHEDEEYGPEQLAEQNLSIIGRVFWYSVLR